MDLSWKNAKRIMMIIAFGILLYVGLQHLDVVNGAVRGVFGLLSPFLVGAVLAFILNVPMRFLERLLPQGKGERSKRVWAKLRRPLSLMMALLIVVGITLFVVFMVLPELVRALSMIKDGVPWAIAKVQEGVKALMIKYPELEGELANFAVDWDQIGKNLLSWLQKGVGSLLSSTVGFASSVVSGTMQAFFVFVFMIYALMQKERLYRQFRKICFAFLPEAYAQRTLSIGSMTNKIFSSFLSRQCLETVILGSMFFLAMTIFRFPYALMISVLIGFMALIPLVGAFIGCTVGALLILMVNPVQAFWFVVMFLIIQQIEGNLIYPNVVGSSVGLPAMWVLVAITIGGSLMGIVGMLLFIPLCSLLYTLFREWVNARLARRNLSAEP